MRLLISLLMLALSTSAQAKTITVAVIDTGVDTSVPKIGRAHV